ncbi:MAG: choice-of-anchor D domain-containing protein [Myxococcales bacterium]
MRAHAWTLAPLVLASACCKKPQGVQSQQGTLAIENGQSDVTGAAVDFGTACPGSQGATVTLSLTAASSASVEVTAIAVAGTAFSATLPTLPIEIPAGTGIPLSVTFTAGVPGPASGSLTVTSDATDSPTTVTLTGTGSSSEPYPGYSATCDGGACKPFLSWANVAAGSSSDQALVIADTGCQPLAIQAVSITGAPDGGAGPFGLPGLPPMPVSVVPGTPFTLTVSYSPPGVEVDFGETLTVTTDAPDGGSPPGVFQYALTGAGTAPDVGITCNGCAGSPPSYDFGAVTQGVTASETFTIINNGAAAVQLAAPAMSSGIFFSVASGWDGGTLLGSLGSGANTLPCTVQFTSPGSGVFDDQLLVAYSSSAGSGQAVANLVAHSAGELCPSPNPLVIPQVGYCGSQTALLDVQNCGNANVLVTAVEFADGGNPAGAFSVDAGPLPQNVPADGGLEVQVTYQDNGDFDDPQATLLVLSGDAGTLVQVQATAQAVPRPGDYPAQLPDSGFGCNVTSIFAAAPGSDAPLYAYGWSIAGTCTSSFTLVSDGGTAWVTPIANESSPCFLCLQEWEQPDDGGFDCGFDAGASGHCTALPPLSNCP